MTENGTPQPRTPDELRLHYEVERELAGRLRHSTREERTALFAELYGELFRRVPHHPRAERLNSEDEHALNTFIQMRLLREHLQADTRLVEFAPGNCWLAYEAAKIAGKVTGIDISDQRDPHRQAPPNFEHLIYDGYHLALEDGCADVAYSYQFLEHLHPDDVAPHLELVRRLLRPGGIYVFDTPHLYSGPHDISREFSSTLDCFHFQEWTYRGMRRLLSEHGFTKAWICRMGRTQRSALVNSGIEATEWSLTPLPHRLRRALAGFLFPSVAMVAMRKD